MRRISPVVDGSLAASPSVARLGRRSAVTQPGEPGAIPFTDYRHPGLRSGHCFCIDSEGQLVAWHGRGLAQAWVSPVIDVLFRRDQPSIEPGGGSVRTTPGAPTHAIVMTYVGLLSSCAPFK